jgi:serine/threonine protein kinase
MQYITSKKQYNAQQQQQQQLDSGTGGGSSDALDLQMSSASIEEQQQQQAGGGSSDGLSSAAAAAGSVGGVDGSGGATSSTQDNGGGSGAGVTSSRAPGDTSNDGSDNPGSVGSIHSGHRSRHKRGDGKGIRSRERAEEAEPTGSGSEAMAGVEVGEDGVIKTCTGAAAREEEDLELREVLGTGSFGTVYLAKWKGREVAVKTLQLPASASATASALSNTCTRERMAVQEAAVSTTMVHSNIVAVHNVRLTPLMAPAGVKRRAHAAAGAAASGGGGLIPWQLQLIMEYCDQVSNGGLLGDRWVLWVSSYS